MRPVIFAFMLSFMIASSVQAMDIVLKNGQKITGTQVEKTDQYIKVDSGLGIAVTYYFDEIESIDGQALETKAVKPVAVNTAETILPQEPVVNTAPPAALAVEEKIVPQEPIQEQEAAVQPLPKIVQKPMKVPEEALSNQAQDIAPVAQTVVSQKPGIQKPMKTTPIKVRYLKDNETFKIKSKDFKSLAWLPIGFGVGIFMAILFFILVMYVLSSFPVYKIAKRLNEDHAWLAWIPLVQLYLICKMGQRPYWVLLTYVLSCIPFIGIIFILLSCVATVYLWMGVCERLEKPNWLGILIVVPVVNIIFMWYLALSEK